MIITIGRHINGITLNDLEFVLDEEGGKPLEFSSQKEAEQFLLDNGEEESNLYMYVFQVEEA